MDNQQASENIRKLSINAVFGDGHLWKHPECSNYKVIYTSITPELLELKRSIAPEIFTTGVVPASVGAGKGRYANAKPLYRLASVVRPEFTEAKRAGKYELVDTLTVDDVALWYLDDGCFIKRSDGGSFRYFLCIGDTCNTEERERRFIKRMREITGLERVGAIRPNNSKATVNNKNWVFNADVARIVLPISYQYGVLTRKFPEWVAASETIEQRS